MKQTKRIAAAMCVGAVLTSGLMAQAASDTAQIWNHRYYVEGQIVCCKSANDEMLPLLRYQGSVYLPLLMAQAASDTAQIWNHRYYVEGQIVCCKSANDEMLPLLRYQGSVYLPLRTAQAASDTAQIWNHRYYVEGQIVCCKSANDEMLPLLRYQGSVYLPLRTAGEWMGKQVDWDASSRVISLSGSVSPSYETEFDHGHIWTNDAQQVNIQPEIPVVVDGKPQILKAADGSTIYPLIYQDSAYLPLRAYQDSAYLPLRAIGELMEHDVTWFRLRENHEEIYIRTPLTDAQIQEAEKYLNEAKALVKKIQQTGSEVLSLEESASAASAQTKLDTLSAQVQQLKELQIPSAPVVKRSCEMLHEELARTQEVISSADEILEKSSTAKEALEYLFERDGDVLRKSILQGSYLNGALVRMHQVLNQDGSGFEL